MASDTLDKVLSKEFLNYFLDNAHLFVVIIDTQGKILFANTQFLNSTEYTFSEIVDKSLYHLFVPVSKIETVVQKVNAVIENKYYMQSENPILKKDGSQLIVEWHNFPLIKGSQAVGVFSFGVNITSRVEVELLLSLNEKTMRERGDVYEKQNAMLEKTKAGMLNLLDDAKRLEDALQQEKRNVEKKVEERTFELNQEKARLIASINSFPYGFIVTDNNDNIVMTNERLETILNARKAEWYLEDIKDFVGDTANFMQHYNDVKSSKTPYLIADIDLERKFLDVYISPIFLNPLSNDTIGQVILVNDITERKIIERSKDEFFSIASHELRTPLTAIRGNAELILKHYSNKIVDPQFSEIVSDIEVSSRRLIDLVNEFLNMSRLEQGKIRFKLEPFDVRKLVQGVINELQNNADQKKLFLAIKPKKGRELSVFADTDRTREVILNLISNAISYSEAGGCTVDISFEDHHVKVSVADTGKGIAPQNQNLLFRKFQQANVSLYVRDLSRSSGLGLYISKLMIEAMHGSIYLEKSEIGAGSTFVFTLPVAS